MGLLNWLFGNNNDSTTNTVKVEYSSNPVKPQIPRFQGDYAKAVFLNSLTKPSPIKKNSDYYQYFIYECGIKKPADFHRQMINEGYLKALSPEEKLPLLTVVTLKEILKKLNLPVSGKKAVLVDRIIHSKNRTILDEYCSTPLYSLSEKGDQYLKQFDDYVEIHRYKNWGISWQEYDSQHKNGDSFYTTVLAILNERAAKELTYGLARNDYSYMYQVFCMKNDREQAVKMLLTVFYIQISGVEGIEVWESYKNGSQYDKAILDTYNSAIFLDEGIIETLESYNDIYNDKIVDEVFDLELPFCCFDKSFFLSVIHSIMNKCYSSNITEKNLKQEYRKALRKKLDINY